MQTENDMAMEVKLTSRLEYKLLVGALKIIPMLLAFCYFLNTIFGYLEIDSGFLSLFGSVSFLTLAFLYLASIVFRFCVYHRMFLHYILATDILNTYDFYVGIPVSDRGMLAIYLIVSCAFMFLILYYHQKEKCSR